MITGMGVRWGWGEALGDLHARDRDGRCRRVELAGLAHAELVGLRGPLEPAGLVGAEAVLAGEDDAEAPPTARRAAEGGLADRERDVAGDGRRADVHRPDRIPRPVDEPLPEALHLDEAVPRGVARDLVVPLRERGRRRRRAVGRVVD